MDATRLWPIEGVVRRYAWGSRTAIPELLGTAPDGQPQAELWLGAHASAPARINTDSGSVPLDDWIRRDPDSVLGARAVARFSGELPYLLKILAAAEPLSIQAHPSEEQARAGFDRENAAGIPLDARNRTYRDRHHKPELICALSPFRALNRFREPAEVERRIAALGISGFDPILAPLREAPDRSGLRAFFERWMTLDPAERERLVASATAVARRTRAVDPAHAELVRLSQAYPGDPGVLAPLFLHLVELAPGEAMYLPAGELHSYLFGTGIELMASSDNVLRGGLTSKHVDVPELLTVLDFEAGPVDRLLPEPAGPVEARYVAPAQEFELSVLRLGPGAHWTAPLERSAEIAICTAGTVRLTDPRGRSLHLSRGASVFAPAAAGAYSVEGEGVLYRSGVRANARVAAAPAAH
jgi:mannose-6-phosphate isomerase